MRVNQEKKLVYEEEYWCIAGCLKCETDKGEYGFFSAIKKFHWFRI